MAGLLDWLTQGIGSDMSGLGGAGQLPPPPPVQMTGMDAQPDPSMTDISGGMQGAGPSSYPPGTDPMTAGQKPPLPPTQPTQPMPPAQGIDLPPPATPFPPGTDPMAAGGQTPNGPGLPPSPPVPMPMPRPPGANAPPPAPPGPPQSIVPPPGNGTNGVGPGLGVTAQPIASSPLSRMLGLDTNSNTFRNGMAGLGKGLESVGNNWNKPGLAAFSGSAGSSITGTVDAGNKTTEQQSKYLKDAIAAASAGNTNALNIARTKLALSQAKAADAKADAPDKASVVNSDQQLVLRADKEALAEAQVSANGVKQTLTAAGGNINDPSYQAALKAHNELLDRVKKQKYAALGISPKKADEISKQEGMSADKPVPAEGLTKEKFDALPVGAFFINPKDQRLLIKQPPAAANAGANPAAAAQSPTPDASAPAPVTSPAGTGADKDDDD